MCAQCLHKTAHMSIANMQFDFMPDKGTINAIFLMQQLQQKHQAKKKRRYYTFVDLDKVFDRVPREVVIHRESNLRS